MYQPLAPPAPRLAQPTQSTRPSDETGASSGTDDGGRTLSRVTSPAALVAAGQSVGLDARPIQLRSGTEIPRPDQASVVLARRSFWLLGDLEEFSQRFDARLLCLTSRAEAALQHLFPRDSERFVTALLRPVEALGAEHEAESGPGAESQLRALGARLHSVGMQQEDYGFVGLSLARAVRDSYAAEWTTTLGSAWSEIHTWLVSQLEAGAEAAQLAEAEQDLGARVTPVEPSWGAPTAG